MTIAPTRRLSLGFAVAALVLLLAPLAQAQSGLGSPMQQDPGDGEDRAGQWRRAILDISGGEIPFLLWTPNGASGEAKIRNGPETITAPYSRSGTKVTIDFPHYDSKITAQHSGHGLLLGEWTKTAPDGGRRTLAFRASSVDKPDPRYRFPGDAQWNRTGRATHADVEGEWKINFEKSGVAKGIFEQRRNVYVNGTILTPTGDYRYLAGAVQGDSFKLSVFDGAHAFLITAQMNRESNTLRGEFFSGDHWRERFTAVPAPADFSLPDAFSQVSIQSSDGRLRLSALDEPRYEDKPVIVTVFGTWCPNCHDEAPVLVDLYERYHEQGLEILGLAYEHSGADARARRQIERFKERYGVEWEIELAGESDKQKASASLPAVSSIKSFPTTIFLNRDGTVRAVHSGFTGPATGEKHEELVREFDRLTRRIVASEP